MTIMGAIGKNEKLKEAVASLNGQPPEHQLQSCPPSRNDTILNDHL